MASPHSSANIANLLRRIPPKWALMILAVVLVYWLAQPSLNRTFGWNLPSLASLLGETQPAPADRTRSPQVPELDTKPEQKEKDASSSSSMSSSSIASDAAPQNSASKKSLPSSQSNGSEPSSKKLAPTNDANAAPDRASNVSTTTLPKRNSSTSSDTKPAVTANASSKATQPPIRKSPAAQTSDTAELARKAGVTGNSDMTYGFLKEVGRDRYQSPAGLVYARGSEEGHRLKHIAKHLKDEPSRPGSHGVFDGDMPQVLRWIDEAYEKAKKGDRMAKTRRDEEATIYEFTLAKPIGYVGGSDGRRRKNPSSQRIRIVVNGQNVITAFPF